MTDDEMMKTESWGVGIILFILVVIYFIIRWT